MIYREEKLTQFFNEANKFHLNLKFPCKNSSCTVNILDLNASLRNDAIPKCLSLNQQVVTNTSTISLLTPYTLRPQYHIVKQ